jgi:Holliday junction resolvase RusA-like endonuclease
MRFEITPMPAPRQNRADRWKKRPVVLRYRAYSDALREACLAADFVLGEQIYMEFHFPMPASWSKKKKTLMLGNPKKSRPDTDNVCKGIMDSLLPEDCKVWHIEAKKFWAKTGYIILENK